MAVITPLAYSMRYGLMTGALMIRRKWLIYTWNYFILIITLRQRAIMIYKYRADFNAPLDEPRTSYQLQKNNAYFISRWCAEISSFTSEAKSWRFSWVADASVSHFHSRCTDELSTRCAALVPPTIICARWSFITIYSYDRRQDI